LIAKKRNILKKIHIYGMNAALKILNNFMLFSILMFMRLSLREGGGRKQLRRNLKLRKQLRKKYILSLGRVELLSLGLILSIS
jgi:hypothetical protein